MAPGGIRLAAWRDFARPDAVAAWDRLARDASEANPFFESWFLLPSLHAFDDEGSVVLLTFEHDGQLAGLMPISRSPSYAGWPFPNIGTWLHANCFLGAPLVRRGLEEPFWAAVLDHADAIAGMALFLHLQAMPLGGPLHAALERACARGDRPFGVVAAHERAVLRSACDPATYREKTLSKKRRRELRRQLARLEQLGGVEFVWEEGGTGIDAWIEDFLRIEAAGWKGEQGSALDCSDKTRTMFAEALRNGARRDRLIRLSLLLDGQPLAMLVNFLCKPASFGFKTAFDPRYARFSPGVLLECEYLETLARDDIEWCDSCAAADHPVMSMLWSDQRAVGRISVGIGGLARRMLFAGLLKAELSRNPEGIEP